MSNHVVLLGDSILDNGAYVPGKPAVIDQVRGELPAGWTATLLAVDGSYTHDVHDQVRRLPADASHLIVSAGGNDALGESGILTLPVQSAAEVFAKVADVRERFSRDYRAMLDDVVARGKPAAICTVYDGCADDPLVQRLHHRPRDIQRRDYARGSLSRASCDRPAGAVHRPARLCKPH